MRIGIDVGGTKIEGVILDRAGAELTRQRIPTPTDGYGAALEAIATLVRQLESKVAAAPRAQEVIATQTQPSSPISVGVATPGFLSPRDGVIRNSNLAVLNGKPVDRDLSRRLGQPVRVENDANCFVLSEATDGAAARPRPAGAPSATPSADVVFGATLGTGVGGGLVIDGRVWSGANGSAGEWSHTTLPFWREEDGSGAACVCGRPSCVESYLSGRGLTWDYQRLWGQGLSPVEIGDRAERGEPEACTIFERYEDRLARALAGVVNLLDPRAIVLGGGISNNRRLFENVPKIWERYTVAKGLATALVRAIHGDASGVRGAAWLWPD